MIAATMIVQTAGNRTHARELLERMRSAGGYLRGAIRRYTRPDGSREWAVRAYFRRGGPLHGLPVLLPAPAH